MSNSIPNNYIKIKPKDLPWITSEIKRLVKKQNRFYENYKHDGANLRTKWLLTSSGLNVLIL